MFPLVQKTLIVLLFWNNFYCSQTLLYDLDSIANNTTFAAVVLTNCQRESIYLTLQSLYRLPQIDYLSVFISMDCLYGNKSIQSWIEQKYRKLVRGFLYFPRQEYPTVLHSNSNTIVSCHLHFVFQHLFRVHNYSFLIVLEDDLLFSKDFLLLFLETSPLLMSDKRYDCIATTLV